MTANSKKAEWERENMSTLSCRIRKEEAEKFRQYALYMGTTVHGLLTEYVRKCIELNDTVPTAERADSVRMQNEITQLKRKLKIAEEAITQARERAIHAEEIVMHYLQS